MSLNLEEKFKTHCNTQNLELNPNQIILVKQLDNFYKENFKSNLLKFFSKQSSKKSFYLHGDVGVGKTMILDFFFNLVNQKKHRLHFNEFMLNFHDFVHDHKDKNETKSADTAVAKIKDVLSTRVADVKPSKNLAKSVARLIADENAMDAQMERFMRMHNSDFKGAPKILEVNAKHPLISALNKRLAKGDFAEAGDFVELIYQSALISDGKQVDDPHAFAEKLAKVMQRAL